MLRFKRRIIFGLVTGVAAAAAFAASQPKSGAGAVATAKGGNVEFNRDIRTILSDNCFACHGPDENKRKAKLRFDQKEVPFKPAKSGEIPIVAGDPAKSELIKRITSKDEDEKMPPPKSGKKLSAQQIDLLTKWIAQGAKWQNHWSCTK